MGRNNIEAGMSIPPTSGSASGFNDPGEAMDDALQNQPSVPAAAPEFNDHDCTMGNGLSDSLASDSGPSDQFNDL